MSIVKAKINFFSQNEGGRLDSIPVMDFGCPVYFEGIPELSSHAYDCRLMVLELNQPISPGETIDSIGIKFLSPEEVIPKIKVGTRFSLWEGKIIGKGEIVSIT